MSVTVVDPDAHRSSTCADPPSLWARAAILPTAAIGHVRLALVLMIAATGLFAELLAPYNPTANDFGAMTEAPSVNHWLGTDQFGRDLLSRIIFGARTALIVGLSSAFVGG